MYKYVAAEASDCTQILRDCLLLLQLQGQSRSYKGEIYKDLSIL